METGVVIAWNECGGFGFIQPDFGGAQVFVHCKQARVQLAKGLRVQFSVRKSHKGLTAHEVVEV